jgi:glycosyltransferase involved in cell wall biosynthesis
VKASVIVPAHNNPGETLRAVQSLRAQVEKAKNVEVIVVDDGSDPPLAKSLRGELDGRRFRIIRNERVLGRGAARNAGSRVARGAVLVFMDSDMTAHPDLVQRHLSVHDVEDGVGCIGRVIWTGTSLLDRYLETRGVQKLRRGENVPWRYLVSGNFSCTKSDFQRAGCFNEGITRWGGEDTLMGYDLHEVGVKLLYAGGAVTYHHNRISLQDVCRKNYTFGRYSLPIMVARSPAMLRELRGHYLTPPAKDEGGRPGRWGHRLVVRVLLRFPGQRLVMGVLRFSGRRISFFCYDYLVYSNILKGFRDYLRLGDRPDDAKEPDPGAQAGPDAGGERHVGATS